MTVCDVIIISTIVESYAQFRPLLTNSEGSLLILSTFVLRLKLANLS